MSFLTQPNIVIARVIGIIAIAAGFLLGIEGLNQPDSIWFAHRADPHRDGLMRPSVCVLSNHHVQNALAAYPGPMTQTCRDVLLLSARVLWPMVLFLTLSLAACSSGRESYLNGA